MTSELHGLIIAVAMYCVLMLILVHARLSLRDHFLGVVLCCLLSGVWGKIVQKDMVDAFCPYKDSGVIGFAPGYVCQFLPVTEQGPPIVVPIGRNMERNRKVLLSKLSPFGGHTMVTWPEYLARIDPAWNTNCILFFQGAPSDQTSPFDKLASSAFSGTR